MQEDITGTKEQLFTLEMFEKAMESLKQNHVSQPFVMSEESLKQNRVSRPFVMSETYYQHGVDIYGKDAMEDALKRWNTIVVKRLKF